MKRARELAQAYDDLVPLDRLREGFEHDGQRMSFGSFYKGIHRSTAQRGPAALTLTTSFKDPYADAFDTAGGSFTYAYRAGALDQADNRALRAAFELQTPLVYFRALAPGQYWVVAPMFVTADDPAARMVVLEPGLPVQDMQPGGLVSPPTCAPTRPARRATGCTSSASSSTSCAPTATAARSARCASASSSRPRTSSPTPRPRASPRWSTASRCARSTTSRSTATCSASTPRASSTSPDRLLREIDGPMLRTGLQGFHGGSIAVPRRPQDRPDPHRLELRFERFVSGVGLTRGGRSAVR